MKTTIAFAFLSLALCCISVAQALDIETVSVGNPGNEGRNIGSNFRPGGVDYVYRIGKFEVTNQQYVEFLNSVDPEAINTLGLFNPSMQSDSRSGIFQIQTALPGERYAVSAFRADFPVVYVGWYDAVRFANWMHNGQSDGDTEDGAYTLIGGIPIPTATDIPRNEGARWFLPSRDEWYKAAYHSNTPDDFYWDYPTASDLPPVPFTPTAQLNRANWNRVVNQPTPIGSYSGSPSAYGTFDQAGNVSEWTRELKDRIGGLFGGNWFTIDALTMSGHSHSSTFGFNEFSDRGFRLATIVPEPTSITLFGLTALILAVRFRRR